jgi:hypothetical protein
MQLYVGVLQCQLTRPPNSLFSRKYQLWFFLFAKNVRSVSKNFGKRLKKSRSEKNSKKNSVKGQVHEKNQFSVHASRWPQLLHHTPHVHRPQPQHSSTARDLSHPTPNFYPIRLPIEPLLASYVLKKPTVSAVRHLQTITLL